MPRFPATLRCHPDAADLFSVELGPEAIRHIRSRRRGTLVIPAHSAAPIGRVVSRFLAKVALEALAHRLLKFPDGLEELVENPRLDMLRNHARRGTPTNWPYGERRIYDTNAISRGEQIVHEFDFILTDRNEWYFILVIFGIEFAINCGGPGIEGYQRWLRKNNSLNPLYSGKNAEPAPA